VLAVVLLSLSALIAITVSVVLIRSTPNTRVESSNHQQMARLLDRILADDQRLPFLPTDVAERASELLGQYYQDRNRTDRKAIH
jgi:hypothetical protein